MPDFKPDQAKLQAAYDAGIADLAALHREIGELQEQADEKQRAAAAIEQRLTAWRPYFAAQPPLSIDEQVRRAMWEEVSSGGHPL